MARPANYKTVESVARKASEYLYYVDRDPESMPTLKGLSWFIGYSEIKALQRRSPDHRGKSFKKLFISLRREICKRQQERLTQTQNK